MSVFLPDVFVSFTTIPSRLHLVKNNESLFLQDYPNLKTIFLTLPMNNMRGQPSVKELPTWLNEEPFLSRVKVVRPEKDYGPIMKYVGAVDEIPDDSFVFVCDDDRYYKKDFISRCVAAMGKVDNERRKKIIVNGYEMFDDMIGIDQSIFHLDFLYGYDGLLLHKDFLKHVKSQPLDNLKTCCLRNDDDVVSVWARDDGYKKVSISSGLDTSKQPHDIDALSTSYDRAADRHACQAMINSQYADGLLTAIIVLSIFTFLFLISFLVMFVLWYRKRKTYRQVQKEQNEKERTKFSR